MKLYFTGAASFNAEQKDKNKSLGGYKSSTEIPNDLLGNLFGDISMYTLDEKLRETKAIIIYNESNSDLEDLYIWFDKITDSLGLFEVAAVALTPNSSGEVYMEYIDNIRASPYVGNFVQADTVSNKQLLSNLFESKSYLGLWLRRSITNSDKSQFNPDTLYSKYLAQQSLVTQGKVNITLEWT